LQVKKFKIHFSFKEMFLSLFSKWCKSPSRDNVLQIARIF
jgi:hypothetical protein